MTTIDGPSEIRRSATIPIAPSPITAIGHQSSINWVDSSAPVASRMPSTPSVRNTTPIQIRMGFMCVTSRIVHLQRATEGSRPRGPFRPLSRGPPIWRACEGFGIGVFDPHTAKRTCRMSPS